MTAPRLAVTENSASVNPTIVFRFSFMEMWVSFFVWWPTHDNFIGLGGGREVDGA